MRCGAPAAGSKRSHDAPGWILARFPYAGALQQPASARMHLQEPQTGVMTTVFSRTARSGQGPEAGMTLPGAWLRA